MPDMLSTEGDAAKISLWIFYFYSRGTSGKNVKKYTPHNIPPFMAVLFSEIFTQNFHGIRYKQIKISGDSLIPM